MDDTGKNRCTAQANQNQAYQGEKFPQREQQSDDSDSDHSLSQTNYLRIIHPDCQEAAERPANSNPYKEQAGKTRCLFCGKSRMQCQSEVVCSTAL